MKDLLAVYIIQELSFYIFILEFARKVGGTCFTVGIAYTPGGHTHMVSVHYHPNMVGLENSGKLFSDLNG